ncbi:uncharacterized protein FSUBG_988 [Fusarium subglutinans]|uniref:BTB domain-containing protein n=1 Tax=Gibberella subglutinans TaxID=42677 RepID=A0A8H5QEP6_GIBSU|nr:uncharacterized protein FSUBG_988 [Fusarium subglutinans]KAF5613258.1 hypothetical protein FSUBG_988 [Fusarium subglutinans]
MNTSSPLLNANNGVVSSDSVTQITPDGDVMLVVGQSQHKIQVSSHFLKLISPVFRAMLDAPMKERNALANKPDHEDPIEIILPEDKEQPMDQVLRTLYSSDPSATKFSVSEAKEIAILADKYGMVERLQVFASFWLLNATKTDSRDSEVTEDDWNTLVVAYILKVDWAFFAVTKGIRPKSTSLLKFINRFHDKHTGLRLGMAIEELRNTHFKVERDSSVQDVAILSVIIDRISWNKGNLR